MIEYTSPDQIPAEEHYNVPVSWIGEDDDIVAFTTDLRRGLAAISRYARLNLRSEARPHPTIRVGRVTCEMVRVVDDGDMGEWMVLPCQPGDMVGIPVVWARDVDTYLEGITMIRNTASAALGDTGTEADR